MSVDQELAGSKCDENGKWKIGRLRPVDDQHCQVVSRMLELTRPTQTWQTQLLAILRHTIMENDLRNTLHFLLHILSEGKTSLREYHSQQIKPDRKRQPAYLYIDFRRAPAMLNVETLKNLVISLGFEVEEPDGYHRLDDVSLAVSDVVLYPALEGMSLLISLLLDMPWEMLCMVRHLSVNEAQGLCDLLQDTCVGTDFQQERAKSMMSRYPQEMKTLGFYREHHTVKRTPSPNQQFHGRLMLVLRALFEQEPQSLGTFV